MQEFYKAPQANELLSTLCKSAGAACTQRKNQKTKEVTI